MDLFIQPAADDDQPPEHRYSDAGGEVLRNEALTRQLRNLLLLQPLFQLELGKSRLGPNDAELFKDVDTLYLSLSLFDYISGRMVIDVGARRAEALEHLRRELLRMGSSLDDGQRAQVSELVLDALGNARERHRAFSISYFDADRDAAYRREFRLLQYREQSDGGFRYVLTPEGITAYLAMLDVEPKLMQQAEEILIQRLMERGQFRDALHLARRARTRTLDLRETLERHLFRARRAVSEVDWSGDTLPRIEQALSHIAERQGEERNMLQAVFAQDLDSMSADARADLIALRETLHDCQHQHTTLHHDVMGINERYLKLQDAAFRARERSPLPNLEQDVLLPLLAQSRETLAEQSAAITAQLNGTRQPKLFDPLLLVDLIGQQARIEEATEGGAETDLRPLEHGVERFPQALIEAMSDYLRRQVGAHGKLSLSALLALAEGDELDRDARLCLIYLAIGAYNPKDDYLGLRVEAGGALRHPLVSGTDLQLELIADA